ncbi:glutathione binding-like protein [Massilia sp. W12]|uniref:glutathione S-transferase family protein n=1 Tax=Massilia sp. W12 TaxID=3126507 RepID=UPI0030CB9757
MIDLYSWPTPNGQKIHIMLEECGLNYQVQPVNISQNEQFAPAFLAISPNNKIPAMVDAEGPDGRPIALFESGAILQYLADKCQRFGGDTPRQRYSVLQWLMFQMGGFGPMLGQAHHFRKFAPQAHPYAITRYSEEAQRLYRVLNTQLQQQSYVAAEEYTIADIALFPWCRRHEWQGVDLRDFPHVLRWYETIEARPAVQRGLQVLQNPV